MIQVIDYKAGNLTSVVKALHYLGAKTHVTQSPDDVFGTRWSRVIAAVGALILFALWVLIGEASL